MTIEDQVQQAVQAVRDRDRRTRNYFAVAIVIILVGVVVGGIAMTSVLLAQTRQLRKENATLEAQTKSIAKVLESANDQRQRLEDILCLVTANQKVILTGVRNLARKFGVGIPETPDVVTQCKNGKDDVFVGTNGSDTIEGTPRADFINGQGGNDIIRAFGGNDAVFGQDGNDRESGGQGADHLNGDGGNDRLYSGNADGADDVLDGGEGTDRCVIRGGDTAVRCEHVIRRG